MALPLLPDLACRSGIPRLREALQAGAELETRDQAGRTALFRTARLGRTDHVKLLLEAGADPNAADATGEAPLQAAARYIHAACVALLIAAGANLNYCPSPDLTEYSESALSSAVRRGCEEVIELLLKAGASPTAATTAGQFPLGYAAAAGDAATCRRLVAAGANLEQRDKLGSTALHHAVDMERVETIRTLLDLGADVNAKELNGRTPVLAAISPSHRQCVPMLFILLAAKPDLAVSGGPFDLPPLALARQFRMKETANLLKQAGAPTAPTIPDPKSRSHSLNVGPQEVSVEFAIIEDSDLRPEPKDHALAKEVATKSIPALLKNYGWEASPRHWTMLEYCEPPIPLTRLAYLARGFLNRPAGHELEDGPEVLGETYQAALDRFVELGLMRQLTPEELVRQTATIADLKEFAMMRGFKTPSKRADLLEAVLANANPTDLTTVMRRGPYYVSTPAGRDAVQNRAARLAKVDQRLRNQLLEALLESNLNWACLLAQELKTLNSQTRVCDNRPVCDARKICEIRLVLETELPDHLHLDSTDAPLLRAIAAASRLVQGKYAWADWRPVRPPTDEAGKPITPTQLALSLIHKEGAAEWNEPTEED